MDVASYAGKKQYELANHLGNVLATITDKKIGVSLSSDSSLIDHYVADVQTAQDYYPFGMVMPGRMFTALTIPGGSVTGTTQVNGYTLPVDLSLSSRSGNEPTQYTATRTIDLEDGFTSGVNDDVTAFLSDSSYAGTGNGGSDASGVAGQGKYRYGFNGKENDNEVKGVGNQIDYGDRIYDPRAGRFLSIDPLQKKYPFYTPYQFAANSPIENIDLDGREELPFTEKNQYGEKQVQMVPVQVLKPFRGGGVWVTDYKESTPAGKPVTHGMSERDIYRMVLVRMISPGDFTIPEDQYLDRTYFTAEEKVKYYFSHLLTASEPNTKEHRALTAQTHTLVANAILGADDAMADAGVTQINRRNQWFNKFDWASTAVSFLPGSLIEKVGGGLSAEAKFAQTTFSSTFSAEGKFAGRTVDEVAGLLKNGDLQASSLPVLYIERGGTQLILNTRSAAALTKAGVNRGNWNAINVTGNEFFEKLLNGQLKRNNLTNAGSSITRQTGTNTVIGSNKVTTQ